MFGSVMMTPGVILIAFPGLFITSYTQLRRYRDPMRCGNGCLHLPGCRFYRPTREDRRRFVASLPERSEQAEKIEQNPYSMYTGLKTLASIAAIATLVPAIFYVLYHLRMVRLGYSRCNCHHQKNCPLGAERLVAPEGCEGWKHRNGYFDSPNGSESIPGIRIAASPARVIHLQNEHIKRERRRETRAERRRRGA